MRFFARQVKVYFLSDRHPEPSLSTTIRYTHKIGNRETTALPKMNGQLLHQTVQEVKK